MGKQHEIQANQISILEAVRDVAAAVREQTEYLCEENSKDVNSEDTETIKERPTDEIDTEVLDEARTHMPRPSTHGAGLAADVTNVISPPAENAYDQAINTMRKYHPEQNEESHLFLSHEVIQLLQETPHQFVPRGRRKYEPRISWNNRECRICLLRFKNPVHLIQMASLPEEGGGF